MKVTGVRIDGRDFFGSVQVFVSLGDLLAQMATQGVSGISDFADQIDPGHEICLHIPADENAAA